MQNWKLTDRIRTFRQTLIISNCIQVDRRRDGWRRCSI